MTAIEACKAEMSARKYRHEIGKFLTMVLAVFVVALIIFVS